ncbi:hypothetical protein [Eisenbergiella tayi]|uniref:hypothetical protein n=1 Tax=Eisenbergiella tayi TaxID=1432052 RepID=UPI00114C86F4|nr:hypothetical protein [Eisenbergiella tayi]
MEGSTGRKGIQTGIKIFKLYLNLTKRRQKQMEKVKLEKVRMKDDTGGILRIGTRTGEREIVLSVNFLKYSDEIDREQLMNEVIGAYEKYYARVSEYL